MPKELQKRPGDLNKEIFTPFKKWGAPNGNLYRGKETIWPPRIRPEKGKTRED